MMTARKKSADLSEQEQQAHQASGRMRARLLKATTRLLSTSGRKGATARAICGEVGIGAPTLYHYFGDLNGLHEAAINAAFARVSASYRRAASASGPLQAIRDAWGTFMSFAQEEPRMCQLLIQQVLDGARPKAVTNILNRAVRDLSVLHAEGRLRYAPTAASQMLWAAAVGAASLSSITDHDGGIDAPISDALLNGVLEAILA